MKHFMKWALQQTAKCTGLELKTSHSLTHIDFWLVISIYIEIVSYIFFHFNSLGKFFGNIALSRVG